MDGSVQPVMRGRLGPAVAGTLLVVVSCLVGVLVVEGAYRAYLYRKYPQHFRGEEAEERVTAYNVSHWEFDPDFGYVYPPGRIIDQTLVVNGRVTSCGRLDVINRNGNIGPIVGDYGTADLRILVFGDSWSAFHHGGRTWPAFLQEGLGRRLGLAVHVVNFGRDGYGLLQMFDLAAAKIDEWKPDLVIFAFISDDLTRARFWRTVIGEGEDVRVVTTLEPRRTPDLATAADTFLLMPPATYEWCRRQRISGTTDTIIERMLRKHAVLARHNNPGPPRADVLTLRRSFLFDRLVHGNGLAVLGGRDGARVNPSTNPRVTYRSYAEDPGFVRALARVKASRVPWVLVHFAFYPEIKAGREYILDAQQQALLDSLTTLTGKPVLRTTDHVRMPVEEPERMNTAPHNLHPSLWGMEFYANAVSEALIRNHLVPERGRPAASARVVGEVDRGANVDARAQRADAAAPVHESKPDLQRRGAR